MSTDHNLNNDVCGDQLFFYFDKRTCPQTTQKQQNKLLKKCKSARSYNNDTHKILHMCSDFALGMFDFFKML